MTESKIRNRAKHHDLMIRKDGHGGYLLVDVNNAMAAPGVMTLEEVTLWLDDLDAQQKEPV